MLDCKQKGMLTEIECMTAFTKAGLTFSIPYGDHARYDFVLDINDILYKIQCKTSSKKEDGVYAFSCRSTAANKSRAAHRSYTSKEVDFFSTIIDGKCYLVPFSETGCNSKTMRFVPPKNGQKDGVVYADRYELEKQIQHLVLDNN